MKHIAAFALLVLGGNANPTAADVEKVLKDAGAKADSVKVASMIKAFEGKDFNELVASGLSKMASSVTSPTPSVRRTLACSAARLPWRALARAAAAPTAAGETE